MLDGIQRANSAARCHFIILRLPRTEQRPLPYLPSLAIQHHPAASSSCPPSPGILIAVMVECRVVSVDTTSGPTQAIVVTTCTNEAEAPHVQPGAAQRRHEERRKNSNSTPSPGWDNQRTNISASAPAPRVPRVYSSSAEAIANFRPTSRQVISGIAPHVFDERKRRRSSSQHRSRSPKPYWHPRDTEKKSSPLRSTISGVFSWDDYSIYLEQSDIKRNNSSDAVSISSVTVTKAASIHVVETGDNNMAHSRNSSAKQRSSKSGWRYLIDIRSLKTVVDKLKLPTSQSHHGAAMKAKS